MMLQQDFRERAEMALRVNSADAEIAFAFHAEHVGEQISGPKQHIFFKALDIDLEKIRFGDQTFGKKRVQAADRHRAGLLVRRHFETITPLRVHRTGSGICRIEIEYPFLVRVARRDSMVMPVRRAGGAFLQLIDDLLNGVESVNDQVIAEPMPGWVLAALNTDIDQHERLAQNARLRDPGGKFGIGIGEQI